MWALFKSRITVNFLGLSLTNMLVHSGHAASPKKNSNGDEKKDKKDKKDKKPSGSKEKKKKLVTK
ncbi:hypothetical protein ACMFMF_001768 [Clarireedia jacksonii]